MYKYFFVIFPLYIMSTKLLMYRTCYADTIMYFLPKLWPVVQLSITKDTFALPGLFRTDLNTPTIFVSFRDAQISGTEYGKEKWSYIPKIFVYTLHAISCKSPGKPQWIVHRICRV